MCSFGKGEFTTFGIQEPESVRDRLVGEEQMLRSCPSLGNGSIQRKVDANSRRSLGLSFPSLKLSVKVLRWTVRGLCSEGASSLNYVTILLFLIGVPLFCWAAVVAVGTPKVLPPRGRLRRSP